ncbi:MAG TPA: hypothetical protein VG944_21720 [Fimbriimonas sp.]|nr:hypothetical protein [Fimbriimonas sp.]
MNDLADKIFILLAGFSAIVLLYCIVLTEAAGALLILSSAVIVAFVVNPQITIAGFNWSVQDLTSIALITRMIFRPPQISKLGASKPIVFFLVVLTGAILGSTVRGAIVGYSLKEVVADLRSFMFPIATIWFMAFARPSPKLLRAVIHQTIAAATILFFISVYRYGLIAAGHPPPSQADGQYAMYEKGAEPIYRVLYSQDAIFMANSTILLWYLSSRKQAPKWMRYFSFMFPAMVIYLQHRSVWIALGIMTLLTAAFGGSVNRIARKVVIGCAAALLIVLIGFPHSKMSSSLFSSANHMSGNDTTLAWREQSWQSLMEPSYVGSLENYIVGRPMGTGERRVVNGRFVEVEAHNLFVTVFTKTGFLGMLSFIFMMLILLVKLWRLGGFARTMAICQCGLLTYWWAYSFDEPQAFLVGVGILIVRDPSITSGLILQTKRKFRPQRPAYLPVRTGELPSPGFGYAQQAPREQPV